METEDGEKTKEDKMAKLEELQREQAEREESSRVFGTEKPGILLSSPIRGPLITDG